MKIDAKYVPEPKFGKTALELLDARFSEPPSVSSKYGVQFAFGLMGGLAHILRNWTYRRPLTAGKINDFKQPIDISCNFLTCLIVRF